MGLIYREFEECTMRSGGDFHSYPFLISLRIPSKKHSRGKFVHLKPILYYKKVIPIGHDFIDV